MRYERKYRIENLDIAVAEQIVKGHPASFRKAFPDRQVNNIYLDTPEMQCYKDNQMGIAQRKKFRVRWYGESGKQIDKPVLEVKIRDNALGYKENHKFPPFELSDLSKMTVEVNQQFSNQMLLQPALLNTYSRSYWESYNGLLRLTIDNQMTFRAVKQNNFLETLSIPDHAIVVELKYAADLESWAAEMMQHLPFRITKNSKYVNGVLLTIE